MTGSRFVLILDDEPAICRGLVLFANHLGVDAMAVSTHEEFFQEVSQRNPTHIILDLRMPKMDGIEVLGELANRGCQAAIAISSGSDDRLVAGVQRSIIAHGLKCAQLLPKPVSLASLSAFLNLEVEDDRSTKETAPTRKSANLPITEEDIRIAISENQFQIALQPIVHCSSLAVKGFETLIRWQHPIRGSIMPDQFIPHAEGCGLIDAVTDVVLDQALGWFGQLSHFTELSLSVNISGKSQGVPGFPDMVEQKCRSFGVSPELLTLEFTETAVAENPSLALDVLTRLRLKGLELSLDDFGMGSSTLAMLANLPFTEMKSDKSFSMTAATSKESRAFIKSTVDLGHELALRTVAEGVEDQATLDYLKAIGCDFAQGYFIARPMPIEQVSGWITQHSLSLVSLTQVC